MTPDSIARTASDFRGHFGALSMPRFEVGLLWLTFALSGIVWLEPAPFDFLCLILVGLWLVRGPQIPSDMHVPILLLGVLTATGIVAAFLSDMMLLSARHIAITIYLYIVTVWLAAVVARKPDAILAIVLGGIAIAAFIAVVAGSLGYFSITDTFHEIFTERERARGTFKDPNVFGPFLVVPAVYGLVRHFTGECRFGGLQTWFVAFLGFGLLLSFSRGAWGNFALSLALSVYLLFVTSRSNVLRFRVLILTVLAIGLMLVGTLIALSFDSVADMMNIRGKLIQSYDTQERFLGAGVAIDVILRHPLGIGAVGFQKFHNVEPHNVYLYSFLIGGWIGGFAYIGLVCLTVLKGVQVALTKSSFQLIAIVFASTFIATALEGFIVDTDHWRHFYILMAGIWGMRSFLLSREQATAANMDAFLERHSHAGMRSEPVFSELNARERQRYVSGGRKPAEPLNERVSIAVRQTADKPAATSKPEPVTPSDRVPRQKKGTLRAAAAARRNVLKRSSVTRNAPIRAKSIDRKIFGLRDPNEQPDRTEFGRRV